MYKNYKIIVAHSGKQHSFQTAYAIKKSNMLFKYITTVYDKRGSITSFIKNFLKGDLKKKANTRSTEFLNDNEVLQIGEMLGLINILIPKLTKNVKIKNFTNLLTINHFGKRVAKYAIKNDVDAVICFDTNCNKLFEILEKKAPHIKRIMDISSATNLYTHNIFKKEIELYKTKELYKEQFLFFNNSVNNRAMMEIKKSQYFIGGSTFVKKSLEYCNVKASNIFIVPYGADLIQFYNVDRNYQKPLKFLFVGNITYRKGINHLLKVFSLFEEKEVILNVVGDYRKNIDFYNKYKDKKNIIFHGFVTRDRIAKIYQDSDVFVFPSLAEGFGLVSLEALSCGLPLLISENSGGNDIVENYKNGIVIDPLKEKDLKDGITWFLNNIDKLDDMSKNSRKTALSYSWDNYYINYASVIKTILERCDLNE